MTPRPTRRSRSCRWLAPLSIAGALVLSAAPMAWSQPLPGQGTGVNKNTKEKEKKEVKPPSPIPPTNPPSAPLAMVMAIVIAGLVVGANMIPSKRGHQD